MTLAVRSLVSSHATTFVFALQELGFNISQLDFSGSSQLATTDVTGCPPASASPSGTPSQSPTATATLTLGAPPSQTASPSAVPSSSAAPTPGVTVDSFNDFVCQPAGTAKGTMRWGAYAVTNGVTALSPDVFTPFDTCNRVNAVTGAAPQYYFAGTNGVSYANLNQYNGHPQNSGACSYAATGYAAPTVRFTADQAYAALTATAYFCPQGGCGGQLRTSLRYIPTASSPPLVLWWANSTGAAPVGSMYSATTSTGASGLQYLGLE